jgi:hypothetical protein
MKAFWLWLLSLFGIKPTVIPPEIIDDTTAHVDPEDFEPVDVEEIGEDMDGEVMIPDEGDDYIPGEVIDDYDPDEYDREPSKFAVLIGINKYDPSLNSDLNGCVNDIEGMYNILVNQYGFIPENIRVLTDYRATKEMIMERIHWLIDHDVPGDELVLQYSGHGSQIRDRDGDELNDYLDEILCPTDLDWDDPLTDDDIKLVFDMKEDEVFLTFICDSCHSGSINKSIGFTDAENKPEVARLINPPLDIKFREGVKELEVKKMGVSESNNVLLSGCRDDQTSSDAYIDGRWQGAMTASLIKSIKNNPYRDWSTIHAEMISILNSTGFTQRPQLNGLDSLIKGRNIFGS